MVELQEASWLTEPISLAVFAFGIPLAILVLIAIARWGFDTIRGAQGLDRGFGAELIYAFFVALVLVGGGFVIALNIWIDVNDSEAQVNDIEEAYDVSLFDVDKDGDVKAFGKMEWDHLVGDTGDSYRSQEPVAIRGDDGELRTDAVMVLKRDDLEDPFRASLAIPEDPEPGKTLVDYKTGEIVGESAVDYGESAQTENTASDVDTEETD